MEICCVGLQVSSSPSSSSLLLKSPTSSPTTTSRRKFFLSSQLANPFLQILPGNHSLLHLSIPKSCSVRLPTKPISAEAWDFGRFLRTLYFFNGPPSPAKFFESLIAQLSGPSPSRPVEEMETSGFILVAGATGGVGRRVVDILRKKGLPVRALVRNEEKARKMLGPDIDLIVGDVTKGSTLAPENFKGVRKVINAVSVIVGPKEGDTPERAKYSQGIKFFEPEIKGDSPELVEFIGMRNLINAVKVSVGLRNGKLLFGFEGNNLKEIPWGALDDVVMGGVSESSFQIDMKGGENGGPTGVFKGVVSTANNGGFTSVRTRNFSVPEDLSAYDGLELRLKGDGRRYKLIVRTSTDWDTVGYTAGFDTAKGQWQSVRVPFTSLRPIFRARTVTDAPPFDPTNIVSLQLMFSKFEYDGKLNPTFVEGPFQLPLSSIRAYIKDPITPRFVHVSSAGVTRPDRPGLDLSKQPPAVRLNKELDFILTFKLKGEDLIRESGIPYAIIRPCALTEEPAGADLIFDQGDDITGKVSREEIARICIAALESPHACDKTFEVKSVIPFSEPFTVDPENPPPEKDYNVYFKTLKDGITGKELLEQSPAPV
ncbi:protein HIGH CHLOROPHYLL FLUORESCENCE PHENOTYPE 173, chloroplastic isoform X1 [Benincasa hispida]|uniref:protein HIGH CHLOROPHYLL FLUORESCENCE PHENOTYPE 173, chloroplastic isoform X1 n=2 Tax=Benincasa hispida TaxID=102211 RepID=UPI0019019F88|nr:protein HIGH CHLOROPHYLL FLUORESCENCE PHENOTYPE 173, chloroplastic isoform X1 [Benincasa hispida]